MVDQKLIDAVQSQLESLDPSKLRYGDFDSQSELTVDSQNDLETSLQSVANSVSEDSYDRIKTSLDSITAKLYGGSITELAEFNRANYEQEIWEKLNPSEEEKVSVASESANSASIDKLDELVHAAENDLVALRDEIVTFLSDAKDA